MGRKKTPKFEALVVNAIRRLQDAQGLSPREISNYISKEYDVPSTEIKKQIKLALKRGVSYGILQRSKGGHYTCAQDFLRKQPMDKHDINELKCRSRRRRSRGSRRRSSRQRRGRIEDLEEEKEEEGRVDRQEEVYAKEDIIVEVEEVDVEVVEGEVEAEVGGGGRDIREEDVIHPKIWKWKKCLKNNRELIKTTIIIREPKV
ncbi:hypothetical protein M0804_010023 [Polistes exclamans]|nr:hypothetical protein M0804_010023 [Polistes exclamans]